VRTVGLMTPEQPNRRAVRILDEDRTLAAVLTAEDLAVARNYAVADVVDLPRGSYHPTELFDGRGLLGLLVLKGLLIRRVAVADRHCGELVGAGAVLRPWDDFGRNAPLPFEVSWRVLQRTRLALLDRRFMTTVIHWPALMEAFAERATERAQTWLSTLRSIAYSTPNCASWSCFGTWPIALAR
jgi:CRP/FNR family transcriptional regulator, cyclic AMP receptor protein